MATIVYPSGSGLTLPTSGELVGVFAGFLRIKGAVTSAGAGPARTAGRYYRGQPVEEGSVKTILDLLVASTLPSQLMDAEVLGPEFDASTWARELAGGLAARWDRLASSLNGGGFPIVEETTAPLPFLRMVALDAGLRWGAYQALRVSRGHEPVLAPSWLSHRALAAVMDELSPPRTTLGDLRKRARVSRNTMDAWRAGTSLPSESNLVELAAAFAKVTGQPREKLLARLRLAVGVGAGLQCLDSWVDDQDQVKHLIDGFAAAARSSFDYFRWLPLPMSEPKRIEALREVVQRGAGASISAATCSHLEQLCIPQHQEVAADLRALQGEWTTRINYWFQQLGARESAERKAAAEMGLPAQEIQSLMKAVIAMMMSMRNFDRKPSFENVVILQTDDRGKARNRVTQAQQARSVGNVSSALIHIARAIELQPQDPAYRYLLGAWLGELVRAGHLEHLNASLASLHRAVALDPKHFAAATEIGIVLTNAGLIEEAEKAYADAADISASWHCFHMARGRNLIALGSSERARASLRRALELEPRNQDARAYLAALLMKLGETDEARKHAREVQHRSGEDPLAEWEALLERRPNKAVLWAHTPDGWVAG